jgi:hypothetical protein
MKTDALLIPFAAASLALASAGCFWSHDPAPAPTLAPGPAPAGEMTMSQRVDSPADSAADAQRDAAPPHHYFYRLDIYQIAVPFGTISANINFWRRIDEQCVDVATYDLLFKNGVRVGEAPLAEIETFKKYLDPSDNTHLTSVNGAAARGTELEQHKDLLEQTIMYYDRSNNLWGRSFNRCSNVVNLSFEPTPRKPGFCRVELCPVVRTARRRMEFTVLNNEEEIQVVHPENFYDLNLRADIAPGSFLIVGPSPEARRSTSVGHAFFTIDGPTSLTEQILLIVPHAYIVDDTGRSIYPAPTAPGN